MKSTKETWGEGQDPGSTDLVERLAKAAVSTEEFDQIRRREDSG